MPSPIKFLRGDEKMLYFLIGLFLGANISLFLYACILAVKQAEKEDYEQCQKKDITG